MLASAGLESDAVLQDYDTLSALLAGASAEVTNTGYSRKTLTDADIAAYTVDDTSDATTLPLADQTFATISAGEFIQASFTWWAQGKQEAWLAWVV